MQFRARKRQAGSSARPSERVPNALRIANAIRAGLRWRSYRYTAVFRPQHTLVWLIVPKTKSLIRFGREMRALHWRAVTRLDVSEFKKDQEKRKPSSSSLI